jgi:DNA-binding beta-propeller fold protein YncE
MTSFSLLRRGGLLAVCASFLAGFAVAAPAYRFVARIPVPGDGGWDYLTVDSPHQRLFVSHGTCVVEIDTAANRVVRTIAGTPGVHGIALAPELHRGFTSNGREDQVGIVDLGTGEVIGKVATGANPDAILYSPRSGEVYVANGRAASATVVEARSGRVLATIPLGGKPEFAQEDAAAGRVFVNLEDRNEVVAIATATHEVVARWPLAPGEEPTGLAIDREHHRLFAGCGNERMVVLDSRDGHVVASVAAGRGIDAAEFDPGTQLAFVSNGRDGTVTVVHEDTPDCFTVVQTLSTEPSARTMAVDPATHRIYLTAGQLQPAKDRGRPSIVPGSVYVLVYELADGSPVG